MTESLRTLPPPGTVAIDEGRPRHPKRPAGDGGNREWMIVDYTPQTFAGGEVFLPGMWKRMHDDETFGMFFHEGPEMNFWQFVALLSDPVRRVQLIIGHDEKGTAIEHAGFVILDNILLNEQLRRAMGNFVFFKEYWNRHDSLDIGWAVLNNWFGAYKADTITGITPEVNVPALRFVKRLGFVESGRIPNFTIAGGVCAGVFTYMTREMWKAAHLRHFGVEPVETEDK